MENEVELSSKKADDEHLVFVNNSAVVAAQFLRPRQLQIPCLNVPSPEAFLPPLSRNRHHSDFLGHP